MQVDRYVAERRRKEKKRRGYFWTVAIFLAAYFVGLGVFAFVVRLPAFQAGQIRIEGANAVSQSDIMSLLEASVVRQGASARGGGNFWKSLLGFKNILIWPDALPSSTLALIPRLAAATISKDYLFHTITVNVAEREPLAVWCIMQGVAPAGANEQCFWFDNQGVAFEKTFETQGNAILTVHDDAQNHLALNEKVLPDEFIPSMVSIINVLQASGLGVNEIALHDLSLEQIDVTLAHGPALHFSLRFPATNDLPVLKDLAAKPGFNKLEYIDFTVENRAYYK